ncbi:hypothetical protein CYLTODRAFT_346399 [Cylindrobasidium torrendii FP15055 ss-10]|uniref:DNA mismatch repair proteins mutS family domain-containing protein n=1 Tax=Cylindrobasidium torrendii FP15055 ss-10 TaxID=1314674 RepID=A0A0D7BLD0_9AGAR|nr:hypothetical protein CYLTODRAFT_346399 [Cylindrobasidium torrendii FP15055 ss-10]
MRFKWHRNQLYDSNRVAMAYYDPLKCKMYVMEDTMDTAHYDLSKMVFEQSSPDLVLTTSKADDQFIETMRELVDGSGGVFQIRAYKDFNPGKGRDRLASLQLLADLPPETYESINSTGSSSPSSGGHLRNASAYMSSRRQEAGGDPTLKRWTAAIRLSNYTSMDAAPLCLSAVGALLDHLVRERAVNDLENEGIRGLDIREIEMLALDKVMQINADALSSLQIFENESHACAQSDKTKEGLSLFGILNTTKTTLGKALLQTWLLRPSLSLEVIHSRHDAVACFVRPDNSTAVASLHGHLKGIKNVPRMLGILKDGRGKLSDWQGLVKFAFHCAMLKDALTELNQAGDIDIVNRMSGVLDIATLREVGNRINETIDWEESSQAGRVCVRAHVDEELDNRKTVYYGIDSVLSNVAQKLSTVVPPDYASSLNIVYFPQLGFLICVPMREEWRGEAGISVIDGWTFQFSSESHVYFKSKEMNDMDIHIGDLHSVIVDREIEIVQALLEEILVHYDGMTEACDVCAELDCLLAFADAARLYDYRRPRMVEDNLIQITQGRHPLQEQVVDTFVPNDARLAGSGCDLSEIFDVDFNEPTGWNNVVLCTGANACGKSVFLKQIALIQFMAQIGCFVPADSATLGILTLCISVFTRISTRESVSKVQSAFMIDLNQVSLALRNSTPRSLILLDEFGKGTLSTGYTYTDGAGLLCGVLKHLLDRGVDCPKVLAATHFHDVFREELLDPDTTPITFLHMQVMFTAMDGAILESDFSDAGSGSTRAVNPNEKITYLYRVAEGLSLMSHAAKCAEIFGVPTATVQRAQYVSNMISNHEIGTLLDEDMDEAERQDLADAEAVCRRFISWDFENEDDRVKERLAAVLGKRIGEEEDNQDIEMADGNAFA